MMAKSGGEVKMVGRLLGAEWTADTGAAAVEDVGVDLCRAHIPVAEELLHHADAGTDSADLVEQTGRQ